ncbi:unnamed protein product [Sphagnum jensenii]|uniref:Uncharacterized protein n=1 Tax=Sphagnum jensenii TaxID=128206 RepID=A0ABP1BE35_9BRYO
MAAGVVSGPAAASGSQQHSAESGMAWKWILEKLLLDELPVARSIRFINDVIRSHVHDIEEPQHRQLLERVAVRCLEEMDLDSTTGLDPAAIPLVKALTEEESSGTTTAMILESQYSGTGLLLRVETEAVLSFLRKASDDGKKDWAGFSSALEHIFPKEDDDIEPQRKNSRQELAAFLHLKESKEEEISKLLEKYPLGKLQCDLLSFVEQKKTSFQSTFLEQLSQVAVEGNLQALMPVQGKIPTGTYEQFKEKCSWMAVDLRTECGIGSRMDTVGEMCDGILGTEDVTSAKHTRDIYGMTLEMTKSISVKREITPGLDAQECGGSAGFVVILDECAIQDEGEQGENEGPPGTVIKGQSKESKHKHAERQREITLPGKMGEEVDSGTDRVPNDGHATPKIGVPFQAVIPGTQTGNATEGPRKKIVSNVEVKNEDDKESGSRGRMETKNGTDGARGADNNYGQCEMHERKNKIVQVKLWLLIVLMEDLPKYQSRGLIQGDLLYHQLLKIESSV